MARELDDQAWAELQMRVADTLTQFASEFGARSCEHEDDWADCFEENCGFADSKPRPGAMPMIQHWVLLTATTDMARSGTQPATMVVIDAPGQPGYVSRGMANDYLADR